MEEKGALADSSRANSNSGSNSRRRPPIPPHITVRYVSNANTTYNKSTTCRTGNETRLAKEAVGRCFPINAADDDEDDLHRRGRPRNGRRSSGYGYGHPSHSHGNGNGYGSSELVVMHPQTHRISAIPSHAFPADDDALFRQRPPPPRALSSEEAAAALSRLQEDTIASEKNGGEGVEEGSGGDVRHRRHGHDATFFVVNYCLTRKRVE